MPVIGHLEARALPTGLYWDSHHTQHPTERGVYGLLSEMKNELQVTRGVCFPGGEAGVYNATRVPLVTGVQPLQRGR